MVYEPQEDSTLLQRQVSKLAYGRVLDMGTGIGPQAYAAACSDKVFSVLAVDIDPKAITLAKARNPHKKITYKVSDLFSKVRKVFDTILFNPPYLPAEQGLSDPALVGGKHGYETTCRFLQKSLKHLSPDGQILMVYSSLTKPAKVQECASQLLLDQNELGREHVFFEDIIAVRFQRSSIRKQLEKEGFSDLTYFAKGKRGLVFIAGYKKKKVAVKIKNPSSDVDSIAREVQMLELLNLRRIGPKIIAHSNEYLAESFVEGLPILEFIQSASRKDIIKVLKDVLAQCRKMDKLGVSKEEMTRPVKHVIVQKNKQPVLIDFERSHITQRPHNVAQFVQFMVSGVMHAFTVSKKIYLKAESLLPLAQEYMSSGSEEGYLKICGAVK